MTLDHLENFFEELYTDTPTPQPVQKARKSVISHGHRSVIVPADVSALIQAEEKDKDHAEHAAAEAARKEEEEAARAAAEEEAAEAHRKAEEEAAAANAKAIAEQDAITKKAAEEEAARLAEEAAAAKKAAEEAQAAKKAAAEAEATQAAEAEAAKKAAKEAAAAEAVNEKETAKDTAAGAETGGRKPSSSESPQILCSTCGESLSQGTCIFEKSSGLHFHQDCFKCTDCNKPLHDTSFSLKEGKVYCTEHYAEHFLPKCANPNCGKPVTGDAIDAGHGNIYHAACFTCGHCNTPLAGGFVSCGKSGEPWCKPCIEARDGQSKELPPPANPEKKALANCAKCGEVAKGRVMRALGKTWHADCFACVVCNSALSGKFAVVPHGDHKGMPCCTDCRKTFMPKCEVCGEPAFGSVIKTQGKVWHTNCFNCSKCGSHLESFALDADGKPECPTCHKKLKSSA